MQELDEKIAMLERAQRMEKRGANEKKEDQDISPALSLDEIRMGIRKNSLRLPNQKEFRFKTDILFPEQIPMIVIDDFYPDKQDTEDMVIYTNNEENVGQTLVHLPEDMKALDMKGWVNQIKEGMKAQNMYADVVMTKSLPFLDYIAYRTPSSRGWIYNIVFRIHKVNRRIAGAYNCMDKDKDTYGRLIEAMILETHSQLEG